MPNIIPKDIVWDKPKVIPKDVIWDKPIPGPTSEFWKTFGKGIKQSITPTFPQAEEMLGLTTLAGKKTFPFVQLEKKYKEANIPTKIIDIITDLYVSPKVLGGSAFESAAANAGKILEPYIAKYGITPVMNILKKLGLGQKVIPKPPTAPTPLKTAAQITESMLPKTGEGQLIMPPSPPTQIQPTPLKTAITPKIIPEVNLNRPILPNIPNIPSEIQLTPALKQALLQKKLLSQKLGEIPVILEKPILKPKLPMLEAPLIPKVKEPLISPIKKEIKPSFQEIRKQNLINKYKPFLNEKLKQGSTAEAKIVIDNTALNKIKKEFERLKNVPIGNKNLPEVKRYYELKNILSDKKNYPTKLEYRLINPDNTFININKTQFDAIKGQVSSIAEKLQQQKGIIKLPDIDTIQSHIDDFRTDIQDALLPLKKTARAAGEENLEYLINTYKPNISHTIKNNIVKNTTKLNLTTGNYEITGEGLFLIKKQANKFFRKGWEDVKELGKINSAFDRWKNKRIEKGVEVAQITPKQYTEAINNLSLLKQKYGNNFNVIEDMADKVNKFSKRIFESNYVDTGLVSKDSWNAMLKAHPNHIPYNRILKENGIAEVIPASKFTGVSAKVYRAKGSEKPIADVEESIIMRTSQAIDAGQRQIIATNIKNILQNSGKLIDVSAEYIKPMQINKNKWVKIVDPFKPLPENVFKIKENGQWKVYKSDTDIVQSLKGMSADESTWARKMGTFLGRDLYRWGVTGNPVFAVNNFSKDNFTAAILNKGLNIPFVKTIQAVYKLATGKLPQEKTLQKMIDHISGYEIFIRNDRESAQEMIKLFNTQKKWYDGLLKIARAPFDLLPSLTEQLTRAGYSLGKKNDLEALNAYYESTVNFFTRGAGKGKIGQVVKMLDDLTPFFNASIQGFERETRPFRNFINDPKEAGLSALKAATYLTIPVLLQEYYYKDDPEYKNLHSFVKDFFLPLKLSPGVWIPLPVKPIGFLTGSFSIVPRRIFANLLKSEGANDEIVKNLAQSLSPFDINIPEPGQRGESFLKSAGGTLASKSPPLIKAILQTYTNYDFFTEKPIVGMGLERKPKELQFKEYTPSIYKKAGEITGESPLKLQNLTENILGTIGKETAKIPDFITRLKQGEIAPAAQPADIPFAGKFVVRKPTGRSSARYGKFWDIKNRSDEINSNLNALKKAIEEDNTSDMPILRKMLNRAGIINQESLNRFLLEKSFLNDNYKKIKDYTEEIRRINMGRTTTEEKKLKINLMNKNIDTLLESVMKADFKFK